MQSLGLSLGIVQCNTVHKNLCDYFECSAHMALAEQTDEEKPKRLSQKELDDIIDLHEQFLQGTRGGERAKLGMMDLSYLDLSGRDMKRADMVGTLLCHSELEKTNFAEAN